MRYELEKLLPPSCRIQVIVAPERKVSVWIGGSIWGSLSMFNSDVWISRAEYDEYGPQIVHKKSFSAT